MFIEKNLYKQIVTYCPIPTVDIIFINEQHQILLCLRNNAPLKEVYYIPWGRIYKNETYYDALKRKSKEEVSLDIDVNKLRFVKVYDDIFDNSAFWEVWEHCITLTFFYPLTRNEEKNIKIWDTQHTEYKFFDIHEEGLHDMIKTRIKDIKHLLNK